MSVYETIYKVMIATPHPSGVILDQVKAAIDATKSKNIQVVLAYPPKVGGSYLRTALIHLLGRHYNAFLSRGSYASTDQARDLYFPTVFNQHVDQGKIPLAWVMHCHMYGNRPVTEQIELFNIRTIITSRNILDTLVSYINMMDKAQAAGEKIDDDFLMYTGIPYWKMSADERRDALVTVAPLWYARFYGSWLDYTDECRTEGKVEPLWLTYDDLVDNPVGMLARMAAHADPKHRYNDKQVQFALSKASEDKDAVRFNQGISGRGEAFFTAGEKATIYGIMARAGEARLREIGVL